MRLSKPIFALLFTANLCLLTGCNNAPPDPRQHRITISTDPSLAPSWQQQLGDSAQKLTPEEQQLLANYIERIQYRLAHTANPADVFNPAKTNPAIDPSNPNIDTSSKPSAAKAVKHPISILVATALVEQRAYEHQHPFNPSGKPLTLQEQYPLRVIATPTSLNEELATKSVPQRWQVVLRNLGPESIDTFAGTLSLPLSSSATLGPESATNPVIEIPPTQFVPPIARGKAGLFIVDVPPVIAAKFTPTQLAEPQSIGIVIDSGVIELADGESVALAATNAPSVK
ncbi:hypothetical protein PSAR109036_01765 [Psychrobacter arenosus]|uniref:hypothetical protein n=1 Tax=Psychrobacter arenosus TaxID=256326 RepID=UPI00191B0494|nr:hypothetical protein [Psychrobacter arenosus]